MPKQYFTIIEPGQDEIVEKKSRFIGYISHVESEEEAVQFVSQIKKQHYSARHNCYAYVVGEEQPVIRFSDDGEPGGTAGKPILEVINGEQLQNVCIVVTRYFGGTLLGTGGLVRAYTEAAKACIAKTEIMCKKMVIPLMICITYNELGKLQYILANEGIDILHSDYGKGVTLQVEVCIEDIDRIEKLIVEATAAKAVLERQKAVFSICRRMKE